ncbi:MAG: DUF2169 domain-containing protein [Deltaproteobacteria bacterium]|nr:DUF2169 domain-containing protein [Deltaproteobacteria bacterium]
MKVIKPLRQGLLFKPFEYQNQAYLSVGVFSFFGFDAPRELLMESEMWPVVQGELGDGEVFDQAMPKGKGELLVVGKCFPPPDAPVPGEAMVSMGMGPVRKHIRVFGERVWLRAEGVIEKLVGEGWLASEPAPFAEMPLTWDRAFGGPDFPANPTGKGYIPPDYDPESEVSPLPNLETGAELMAGPWAVPIPTSCGPRDLMLPQRQAKAGTYDQTYIKKHFPGLAPDIDWTFFNQAPDDQQTEEFWRGDEEFTLTGLHPAEAVQRGSLPGLRSRCFVNFAKQGAAGFREVPLHIDTVWFFPHLAKGITIHRGFAPVAQDDAQDVDHLLLAYEYQCGQSRGLDAYRRSLELRLDPETRLFWLGREDDLSPPEEAPDDTYTPPDPMSLPLVQKIVGQIEAQTKARLPKLHEKLAHVGVDPLKYLPPEKFSQALKEQLAQLPPLPPPVNGPKDFPRMLSYLQQQWARVKAEAPKPGELAATINRELAGQQAKIDAHLGKMMAGEGIGPERAQELLTQARQDAAAASRRAAKLPLGQRLEEALNRIMKQPEIKNNPEAQAKVAQALDQAKAADAKMAKYGLDVKGKKLKIKGASLAPPPELPPEAERDEMRAQAAAALARGESLAGWDLTGADLTGLPLAGADLTQAILDSANLAGADLSGAILAGACLAHADLTGAKFQGANLVEASLGQCQGAGADFSGADLSRALAAKADFAGAGFRQAKLVKTNFMNASLPQADLTGAQAGEAVFLESDLTGANLAGAELSKAKFMSAKLAQADLSGAQGVLTIFVSAQGQGIRLAGARLDRVVLAQDCDFSQAEAPGLRSHQGNWRSSKLAGANFAGGLLDDCDFSESDLTGANFSGSSAQGARFMKSLLPGAVLQGANLRQASFLKADLTAADLRDANCYGVESFRARTADVRLDGALLKMTHLGEEEEPSGEEAS